MTDATAYEPPKVWTWEQESGGRFRLDQTAP